MTILLLQSGPGAKVAAGGGPPTIWNAADKSSQSVIGGTGNLTLSASAGGNTGARSTNPLSTGKVYFEVTVNTNNFSGASSGIAIGGVPPDQITGLGSGAGALVIWANGNIWSPNSTGISLGALAASGDVICVAVDIVAKQIWFRKNGGNWNNSGTANPATATGGISCSAMTPPYYGFSGTANGSESSTANFGATAFAQTPPSGFVSWNAAV